MERAERLKSFKTWREGLQSHLPLTIFLCNLLFFVKVLHLGKSFGLLFITDLNNESLVERSNLWLLPYCIYQIYISNARVLTKSVKTDQSESIPDPGIPERPFVKFAHRHSFAYSRHTFFISSCTVFRSAPWLTERLEEAITTLTPTLILVKTSL